MGRQELLEWRQLTNRVDDRNATGAHECVREREGDMGRVVVVLPDNDDACPISEQRRDVARGVLPALHGRSGVRTIYGRPS
jgi:hypothetical protein